MFYQTIYPTYQVFVALGVSCIITLVLMPLFIKLMKKEGVGQQVRADGPQQHLVKQGTPTMGGVVMLVSIVLTCIALAQWNTDLILALARRTSPRFSTGPSTVSASLTSLNCSILSSEKPMTRAASTISRAAPVPTKATRIWVLSGNVSTHITVEALLLWSKLANLSDKGQCDGLCRHLHQNVKGCSR